MRIGSLFSGAGGLDMAVQAVFGGDIVWHSEVDKAASKVLAYRFPGVPNLGDITKVDWADVPAVDVLCGGFPCQDVSAAGKRAGIKDGTRSGLWSVFADAIDALRPQWVVIENVRGLLSATAHRTVEDDEQSGDLESGAAVMGDGAGRPVLRAAGAVLGDLCDLGYDAQWATVSAASVGAPHRRERVFILAYSPDAAGERRQWGMHRGDDGWQAPIGSASHDSARNSDPSHDASSHTGNDGRPGEANDARGWESDVAGRGGWCQSCGCRKACCGGEISAGASDSSGYGWDEGRAEPARIVGGFDAAVSSDHDDCGWCGQRSNHGLICLSCASGDEPGVALLPTPRTSDCFGAGQHGDGGMDLRTTVTENASQWGKYAPAIARWEAIVGPAPAPTEPNKNGNPRLNAAFSEWLMGWPAGWVTDPVIGISRNDQLRIVGNGVCPQQAAAALGYLLAVNA